MNTAVLHHVIAVGTGEKGANTFLDQPAGKALIGICGAVGIVIVVICIFRMIKSVTSGRPGEGFKILIFGLVIGGLLFDLQVTITGVQDMSSLVGKIISSINSVSNG